ncbi:mitochondrial resolvase Ydc2 [Pestalotiopsis sp. NC0098]|nr:mitochondrial resolvase Ydc2 [Pestalotiopsis sp. NC0098]
MVSADTLTQTLKLAQLKRLAVACGVASSGSKPHVARRLEATAHALVQRETTSVSSKDGVLSIDMGIRNLAFAYLTPPRTRDKRVHVGPNTPLAGVGVKFWDRIVLADPLEEPDESSNIVKWSPSYMADMTFNLVQDVLLGFEKPPTCILIERQRFRSGGGSAVQEWTLRVNTLEAMIYSTLRTLKSCGKWSGEVIPILPQRVGPFWLEGLEPVETSNLDGGDKAPSSTAAKNKKAKQKKAKIDLVAKWLQEGMIVPSGQARTTAESYMDRWNGKRTKKSLDAAEPASERLKKLDDLADSLLQGLAWLQWQDNLRELSQSGPDGILARSPL